MRIVQITPGAGRDFYCENCLRDNTLVQEFRRLGHDTLMVPLYLPLITHGEDPSRGTPIFFGGINVYLQQKWGLFRRTPRWLDRWLDSPRLLRWVARRADLTRARDLGETTLSMLRGEDGRQVKELDRLVDWLAEHERPDVVCLSNVLLTGLVRRIRRRLGTPVVCALQDEDAFLDSLPEPYRGEAWAETSRRAAEADALIAPSRYYADVMTRRLGLEAGRVHVVPPGVDAEGQEPAASPPEPPAIGYLEQMTPAKGLDTLVEAYLSLRREPGLAGLRLRVAGGQTPGDRPFVAAVRARLAEAGDDAEFLPAADRAAKAALLRSLRVLAVPTRRPEAFGLFILEALACGVPVVQPRHGAYPEVLEATGGGTLVEPNDPAALADALGRLLRDPESARALGRRGREAVLERFTIGRAARETLRVFEAAAPPRQPGPRPAAPAPGGDDDRRSTDCRT